MDVIDSTLKLRLRPVALAASLLMASQAYAVGSGVIAGGNGSINKDGSTTNVTQTSDKLIINWDNMDVAKGEILNFAQKDSTSAVLNRINSADMTTILGALNANGRVFIVNPNGVLIGNGATVNVGSLVASSLNISDDDFNAGKLNFAGGGNGNVVNEGEINASGSVALIGSKKVENTGTIKAGPKTDTSSRFSANSAGSVTLAAGDDITLTFANGALSAKLNKGSLDALVNNGGLIATTNGNIVLTAWARDAIARSVINNSGTIEASIFGKQNGYPSAEVSLLSLGSGTVDIGGKVSVTNNVGGGTAQINVQGNGINVKDGAVLSASAPGSSASGGIVLQATSSGDRAGYVKFGKATLNAETMVVFADNVLTSSDQGKLPTFNANEIRLRAPQENRNLTLGGDSLSDDEAAKLHNGSGSVSADFVRLASQTKNGLSVYTTGTGGIATIGKLEIGSLNLWGGYNHYDDRLDFQGSVLLNGEISGGSLNIVSKDVTFAGKADLDTLIVNAINKITSTNAALVHAKYANLRTMVGRGPGDGDIDMTRGSTSFDKLSVETRRSANIALKGDTTIMWATTGKDLRLTTPGSLTFTGELKSGGSAYLQGGRFIKLNSKATTGGDFTLASQGDVSHTDINVGGNLTYDVATASKSTPSGTRKVAGKTTTKRDGVVVPPPAPNPVQQVINAIFKFFFWWL